METGIKKAGLTALALLWMAHSHAQTEQQAIKPRAQATVINDSSMSHDQKESDHRFTCGGEGTGTSGYVIVGRKHYGDENKNTHYRCGRVEQFGVLGPLVDSEQISNNPEDGVDFICPKDKMLTGRIHEGDENDPEHFTCSSLKDSWGNTLQVVPQANWSEDLDENSHDFTCDSNTVMIGKYHDGDENGPTRYLCGTLW